MSGIRGHCIEAGDDDDGQPRIVIHSTREELMAGRSIIYTDCVVMSVEEYEALRCRDTRYPSEEENPVNKLTQDGQGKQSGGVRREAAHE